MENIHKAVDAEIRRAEVRGVLAYLAHTKQFIDYRTLAASFGMFSGGSELARVLGEIQTEDDSAGRGLRSSLVVGSSSRIPGRGYFEHARQKLKRVIPNDPDAEHEFWLRELAKLEVPPLAPEDHQLTATEEIRVALTRRLPAVADLFGDDHVERLVQAWELGAASYSTTHPAIEILLAEQLSPELLSILDDGLGRVRQQGGDLGPLLDRLANPRDFRLARGVANELWVAAHAAAADGLVTFEDAKAPGKKPEFTIHYEGEALTVEVVGMNVAQRIEKRNNNLNHMFTRWPRGRPAPEALRPHARDGEVRFLEMSVPVLSDGSLSEKVDALTGLKDTSQLQGRPCPILVISARHQWGFFSVDCAATRTIRRSKFSGIGYAAVYGRKGDYLFEGEEFDGRGYETSIQKQDGILRKSKTLAAVVFLFQTGRGVVFENLAEGCGFPSSSLARFVKRAFDADPELSVFKVH